MYMKWLRETFEGSAILYNILTLYETIDYN